MRLSFPATLVARGPHAAAQPHLQAGKASAAVGWYTTPSPSGRLQATLDRLHAVQSGCGVDGQHTAVDEPQPPVDVHRHLGGMEDHVPPSALGGTGDSQLGQRTRDPVASSGRPHVHAKDGRRVLAAEV
jgi:hypothetical protein